MTSYLRKNNKVRKKHYYCGKKKQDLSKNQLLLAQNMQGLGENDKLLPLNS